MLGRPQVSLLVLATCISTGFAQPKPASQLDFEMMTWPEVKTSVLGLAMLPGLPWMRLPKTLLSVAAVMALIGT